MLSITIPPRELFDSENQEFIMTRSHTLELEHSLVSLSKWESLAQKPFLGKEPKSSSELLTYIECMILNPIYPENVGQLFTNENIREIHDYIESPYSATTFGKMPDRKGRGEVITSELIYYWLVAFNIPFEVERWHLNRLFALIRICNIKNQKPNKRSKGDVARQYRDLNAQRRAQLGTSG